VGWSSQEDGNLSLHEEIVDEEKQDSPIWEQPSGKKKEKEDVEPERKEVEKKMAEVPEEG